MSIPKNELIELIGSLQEEDQKEVLDFAEYLKQKRLKRIDEIIKNIPEGHEDLSENDLKAIEEAREDIKAGRIFDADDVYKRLGI